MQALSASPPLSATTEYPCCQGPDRGKGSSASGGESVHSGPGADLYVRWSNVAADPNVTSGERTYRQGSARPCAGDGHARRTRRPGNPCTCRARSMLFILCGGLGESHRHRGREPDVTIQRDVCGARHGRRRRSRVTGSSASGTVNVLRLVFCPVRPRTGHAATGGALAALRARAGRATRNGSSRALASSRSLRMTAVSDGRTSDIQISPKS